YIDDLLCAFDSARRVLRPGEGQIFNLGGGPQRTISIWREFGPKLERLMGRPIPVAYGPARPGDQRVYVSDIARAERELGWRPVVDVENGIERVVDWVVAHRALFEHGKGPSS